MVKLPVLERLLYGPTLSYKEKELVKIFCIYFKILVLVEIDRLQVGCLQSAGLMFTFPETRDRWALVERARTVSVLFTLQWK